jgi:hypothetical protein
VNVLGATESSVDSLFSLPHRGLLLLAATVAILRRDLRGVSAQRQRSCTPSLGPPSCMPIRIYSAVLIGFGPLRMAGVAPGVVLWALGVSASWAVFFFLV